MRKLIIALTLFTLISPLLLWAEEISLSLDEAIAVALRENRDILLKTEDLKKAKFKIAEAEAGLLPTLNFTGSWTNTRGYYSKDIVQTTTQTTLKQYLYKGGEITNTIRQKQNDFEVTQAILDKTKLELALNVKKAFYTLILANEYADLNQAILENTQEHLRTTQARYENGQASKSDILKIKESQDTVQVAYEVSLNQIESAQSLLKNLLYLEEAVKIKPQGEFSYQPRELAYDEAFLKAIQSRPEIRQYEAQEKADKKAIEITRADTRPSIYAAWDYYSRSTTSLTFSPRKSWQDYNIMGITFSWPVFDGWATKAKVEQAIVDLKETQLTKEKTIKEIALELKNAYLDLKNALAKIKSTQAEVNLYNDTLSVTQAKYKAGMASSLDLSDAALGYAVSLFNQKEAIYDYILAKAGFDKAAGERIE